MNNRATWILAVIALILAGIAWAQGGVELALLGLQRGLETLISILPLLLSAFLIAGLTQVLITREFVDHWLGRASGWKGIMLACLGGAIIPGGPFAYYPIVAVLLNSGASLGALVGFVAAKNIISLTRIPVEIALLGPRLALIRLGLTFFMPPLLGLVAEALFGNRLDRIREAVAP
jgi:uncharacterized membrane protein YraQ (UPF0718 family)